MMDSTPTRRCPACSRKMKIHQQTCRCGWSESGAPEKPDAPATRCCVTGCPMPGSFSENMRGGGPWYCASHRPGQSPEKAQQITERLRQIQQQHKNWRDEMVEAMIRGEKP